MKRCYRLVAVFRNNNLKTCVEGHFIVTRSLGRKVEKKLTALQKSPTASDWRKKKKSKLGRPAWSRFPEVPLTHILPKKLVAQKTSALLEIGEMQIKARRKGPPWPSSG